MSSALNEWRAAEVNQWEQQTSGIFNRPACPGGGHAVHLDGNQNLYRYTAAGRYVVKV